MASNNRPCRNFTWEWKKNWEWKLSVCYWSTYYMADHRTKAYLIIKELIHNAHNNLCVYVCEEMLLVTFSKRYAIINNAITKSLGDNCAWETIHCTTVITTKSQTSTRTYSITANTKVYTYVSTAIGQPGGYRIHTQFNPHELQNTRQPKAIN